MKRLERFNTSNISKCKYFIAAMLFQNPLRIEFGLGWNDINRIGVLSHVLKNDVKAILDPICSVYSNDRASIHTNPFNAIDEMPYNDSIGDKIILIGADDIDISVDVNLISYGSYSDILSDLDSFGYLKTSL